MENHLFVYGSLMGDIDTSIARLLKNNSVFLGLAQVKGTLYDLGSYPGLIVDPKAPYQIQGHLFRMHRPNYLLPFLDEYEGTANPNVPNEYRRELIQLDFESKRQSCWVYSYNLSVDGLPIIESGNYLEYLKNNPNYQRFIDSV